MAASMGLVAMNRDILFYLVTTLFQGDNSYFKFCIIFTITLF
jgi:hypothetical protein